MAKATIVVQLFESIISLRPSLPLLFLMQVGFVDLFMALGIN